MSRNMIPLMQHRGYIRSEGRILTSINATLMTLDGRYSAMLSNLSRRGAKLAVERMPRVGARALLTWLDHDAVGEVAWARPGECGLRFHDPVPTAKLRSTQMASGDLAHPAEAVRLQETSVRLPDQSGQQGESQVALDSAQLRPMS